MRETVTRDRRTLSRPVNKSEAGFPFWAFRGATKITRESAHLMVEHIPKADLIFLLLFLGAADHGGCGASSTASHSCHKTVSLSLFLSLSFSLSTLTEYWFTGRCKGCCLCFWHLPPMHRLLTHCECVLCVCARALSLSLVRPKQRRVCLFNFYCRRQWLLHKTRHVYMYAVLATQKFYFAALQR